MPAANLLTDEGNIATMVQSRASVQDTGAQAFSTMGDGSNSDNNCNIHTALVVLLAVGLIVILRKNGFHALMVEG